MQLNWDISNYKWQYIDDRITEKVFDLKGAIVTLSLYFGITEIILSEDALPMTQNNLNDQLEITENEYGIATYRDKYDRNGNYVVYCYNNSEGSLTHSPWNFARATNRYDKSGNHVENGTI